MENRIKLEAKRSVEIKEIFGIMELWKTEKRPDMASLLQRLDENRLNDLSKGEKENLKRYFQELGLLTSSRNPLLTRDGQNLIDTKTMKVPERGIYKLYYIDDPFVGKEIIDYEEMDPSDREENMEEIGKVIEFEDFEELEDREFKRKLSGDDKNHSFHVQFVRYDNNSPRVAEGNIISNDLTLKYPASHDTDARWKLEVNTGRKTGILEGSVHIDIVETISSFIGNFSEEHLVVKMEFKEAEKEPPVLKNFKKTFNLNSKIYFRGISDDNDWEISLTLPVVPKTPEDATRWIAHLLKEEIIKLDRKYITKSTIEKEYSKILENSLIPDVMKDWYFSVDSFIEELKYENEELYYRIWATEDLFVDYFMATTQPKDWKKKIILIDGSNVAWNHGSKEMGDKPLAKNIEIMIDYLTKNKKFEKVIAFCDANLKYLVEDKEKYDELIQAGKLSPVPSKTIADYFLIDYAQRYGAYIVTGDRYRDWNKKAGKFGWDSAKIEVKKFKIRENEAIVYDLEVSE